MSDQQRLKDVTALKVAIRGVARGEEENEQRLVLMERAAELEHEGLIPDNWERADGSLKEKRETANDVFDALQGALDDAFDDADDYYYYVWVQDWDGGAGTYRVIFSRGGDLYAAPFSWTDDNKVVVDVEAATKVRPITTYVERDAKPKSQKRGRSSGSEQRQATREEMRGVRETRRMPVTGFEMREVPNGTGGSDLMCSGYASVTCADENDSSNSYEMEDWIGPWQESVVRGAFVKSIRENADVAFLVNHSGITMARTKPGTLKLAEDLTGLHYEAKLNPTRPDVQILRAAVDDGAIDESSFAFQVVRQRWSYLEDNGEIDRRWITEVSLNKGDVSPVNYGANPHTGGLVSMRSAMTVLSSRGVTWRALAAALKEIRAGQTISQATRDVLQPILDDLAAIDKLVDADQPKLADLLGVANPDESDEDEDEEGEGDGESEDRSAPARPLILPDYTTAARAALAAARR